jgi:hypothetical protein
VKTNKQTDYVVSVHDGAHSILSGSALQNIYLVIIMESTDSDANISYSSQGNSISMTTKNTDKRPITKHNPSLMPTWVKFKLAAFVCFCLVILALIVSVHTKLDNIPKKAAGISSSDNAGIDLLIHQVCKVGVFLV